MFALRFEVVSRFEVKYETLAAAPGGRSRDRV